MCACVSAHAVLCCVVLCCIQFKMLNSLNNFLFGSGTTGDAAVDQTQASQQGELETKEGDMGWVLVDVAGTVLLYL